MKVLADANVDGSRELAFRKRFAALSHVNVATSHDGDLLCPGGCNAGLSPVAPPIYQGDNSI